ncbi:MAG: bifunctional nuclease family protein [Planctomycetota bacterium]|nr:bifunctional nuclease family protein [Planctomycetota bacterium]
MPVKMELSRILIRELNDMQIIELREVPESDTAAPAELRSFPIVIGLPEAQAIERRIKGVAIKRPQTHDLLANVITMLGGELRSITITDLAEHTFFATLDIKLASAKDGVAEMLHVDARPSDAIALGVAEGVPIFVAEHVLESALRDEPLNADENDDGEDEDESDE